MPVKKGRKAQTKTKPAAGRPSPLPAVDLSALFLYGHAGG